MPSPPTTEQELLERCRAIAGLSVAELAAQLDVAVPANLRQHKGWLGELVEKALGADAAGRSEPDFRALGIELKTLPLNAQGKVQESTWVCTVPLRAASGLRWEDSCVYHKLRHVLWLPVEAAADIPLSDRHIGNALLWRADAQQLAALQADWEELMEAVALGQFESLDARHGEVLQIRPKAAHSRVLVYAIGPAGEPMQTLPRGFYLRVGFTNALLQAHYA
ncbi:DNA mismatch repair endonuclease MutH [Sulfuriflexus sp.]|uniref:DNA mismatch repair endonuclease MutH n=1 Tax=Sulfuriflexus sp. TaxID=2015443 RepID=UPI0028CDF8C0|nr:DNA mismatch repair endonuclease MutH [Sulfuriflexus sp.]MDT8405141.1 DNA mismatch repair endonuclease MutH [Sulfuriflexus sp.]